ncbi:amino acid ABC transporter substrate-binding protein [Anaeromicropila populeti]|uniref:Amino acid ABC transporter substrate-binding protein, PAAT family (TC 3.A.1.3.-) n=1 Tax=Anaeromicropila populeti TaxID=37658 RepID=A0A1I6L0I8_9FIRM|nr:amino acid ABC transporter substrate-binding protein [Anaeromicropila populeti]SFR96778.1 amino acid ABC transporter substrate-binding protein, PAAT family (TC 3.A.1.3.-) [Anaeromicropila populeti]
MKRKIALVLVMVFVISTLAACGEKKSSKEQFVVGFDAEFEPYGFKNEEGEYVGFDLDLAQEVCNRRDWELVKQPIDWDAKDMELSSGSIDCIWNGFTINDREDKYTWSSPYVNNSQVFVVATDAGIENQAGLAGKIIAVQKDSSALAAINDEANQALKESFAEVVELSDYNTAFMELEMGTVDAIAMDIGVAKAQMSSRDNAKFTILEEYLSSEQYGVGFLLGNEELRDKVEATLMDMVEDGTFMKIAEDWDLQDSVCLGE